MDDHPVRKDMAYWKAKHNSPARFRASDWNFDVLQGKLPGMDWLERTGFNLRGLAKKMKIQKYQQAQVQKYQHAMLEKKRLADKHFRNNG